jgi:hypothetical protein
MTSPVKSLSLTGIFMAPNHHPLRCRVEATLAGEFAICNLQFSILNLPVHAQAH